MSFLKMALWLVGLSLSVFDTGDSLETSSLWIEILFLHGFARPQAPQHYDLFQSSKIQALTTWAVSSSESSPHGKGVKKESYVSLGYY